MAQRRALTRKWPILSERASLGQDVELSPVWEHLRLSGADDYQSDMNLHVKFQGSGPETEARILLAVRGAVRDTDAGLPLLKLQTLRSHMEASVELWLLSTAARLFGLFGLAALLMAAAGLYAVRAYTVTRRTREIGIRIAVGATGWDTTKLMLREGALVAAVAVTAGLALSLVLGRALSRMLYHVSASDPLVFGGAATALAVISLVACWLPARRAAGMAPLTALRAE